MFGFGFFLTLRSLMMHSSVGEFNTDSLNRIWHQYYKVIHHTGSEIQPTLLDVQQTLVILNESCIN